MFTRNWLWFLTEKITWTIQCHCCLCCSCINFNSVTTLSKTKTVVAISCCIISFADANASNFRHLTCICCFNLTYLGIFGESEKNHADYYSVVSSRDINPGISPVQARIFADWSRFLGFFALRSFCHRSMVRPQVADGRKDFRCGGL